MAQAAVCRGKVRSNMHMCKIKWTGSELGVLREMIQSVCSHLTNVRRLKLGGPAFVSAKF